MSQSDPTRRQFLGRGLAAGALAAGALSGCDPSAGGGAAGGAKGNPRVRWLLASSFPQSLDTIYGAAEVFASKVAALTDGRFEIQVNAGGELCPPLEVLNVVRDGAAHVGHTAGYYYTGQSAALAFDTAVPFGMSARQHLAWLQAGGLELMRKELFAPLGVVNLPGGNTGVQMGGWFRKPFGSLAELKGLTMRIPGLGGKVMSALGVNAQVIPGGEIYQSLETGRIDATEWVGPYDDQKLGFHKVAKHYYYPGWWEPGPALSFYVNQAAWDKLPAHYREIVETAAGQAGLQMLVTYDSLNPGALQQLLAGGDVKLHPYPRDVLDAAEKASADLLADLAGKDAAFQRVYTHWEAFRKTSARWFGTAELAYMQHAFRS